MSRKRSHREMEAVDDGKPTPEPSLLDKIRNMWQFASFMQYIFLFGKAAKIEDIDVEDFEKMLLQPDSAPKIADMALALLKVFSSHRPLTLETFDEVTRRQYRLKTMKHHSGPFGDDEEPRKFSSFDVFTKIRVLHQLSTWTLNNPNTIRDRMAEDETDWRMEPCGWDSDDRAYYFLDDNRLYRRTDAPLPPPPPSKSKSKKSKSSRTSKRRRVSRVVVESDSDEEDEKPVENGKAAPDKTVDEEEDSLGGMKWELVAVTHDEYNDFLDSIRRSRDPDEKALRRRLMEDVMPVIEQRAEQLRQKEARRLKELENLQKLATAKRSGRLADKAEKRKQQEEVEAAEQKRLTDLKMARKEQEKQRKLDDARESRMMTREQRLKDREVKRILHEEKLKELEEEKAKIESDTARGSERYIKSEMERRQHELKEMQEDEDWTFDCSVCGVYGQNLDDGSHSIECEDCKVWQHSKCHGISEKQAEREDFHFICSTCKRKDQKAKEKISIKLNFSSPKMATSPPRPAQLNGASEPPRHLAGVFISPPKPPARGSFQGQHGNQQIFSRPGSQGSVGAAAQGHVYGSSPSQSAYANGLQWQPQVSAPQFHSSTRYNGAPGPQSNISSRSPPVGSFHTHRPPSQHSGQGSPPDPRRPYATPQASATAARPSLSPPHGHAQTPRPSYSSPQASATTAGATYSPPQMNGYGPSSYQPRPLSASVQSSAASIPPNPYSRPPQLQPYATPKSGEQMRQSADPSTSRPGSSGIPTAQSSYLPGLSPAKHDSPRPASSHGTGTPVLPPVQALSPSVGNTASMSPPVKRASPPQPPLNSNPPVQAMTPTQPPSLVPPVAKMAPVPPAQSPLVAQNQNVNGHGHGA